MYVIKYFTYRTLFIFILSFWVLLFANLIVHDAIEVKSSDKIHFLS